MPQRYGVLQPIWAAWLSDSSSWVFILPYFCDALTSCSWMWIFSSRVWVCSLQLCYFPEFRLLTTPFWFSPAVPACQSHPVHVFPCGTGLSLTIAGNYHSGLDWRGPSPGLEQKAYLEGRHLLYLLFCCLLGHYSKCSILMHSLG